MGRARYVVKCCAIVAKSAIVVNYGESGGGCLVISSWRSRKQMRSDTDRDVTDIMVLDSDVEVKFLLKEDARIDCDILLAVV